MAPDRWISVGGYVCKPTPVVGDHLVDPPVVIAFASEIVIRGVASHTGKFLSTETCHRNIDSEISPGGSETRPETIGNDQQF